MEAESIINDLRVKVTNRQILAIAIPISLALLVPQINFITNNIFLGAWSKRSLGDAGITNVYYLILAIAGNGFNSALQSLISRTAGEDNLEKIHVLIHQAVRIALKFALAGILFTWFVAPLILKPFLSQASYADEMSFLRIRVLGLPFLYLFQLGCAFLVGTLNSRYLTIGFVCQAAINIFFDFTLIKGRWLFPQMGFNGAAVSSVIAEIVGLIVIMLVISRLKLHHQFNLRAKYIRDTIVSKEIIKISTPLVLQYMLSLATWLVFFIMIDGSYDVDDKGISNIMRNVLGFAGIFNWAFASTTNAMVSNLVGQGRKHDVLAAVRKTMLLSFAAALIMATILNIFSHAFFSMFGQSEDFINRGIPVLQVVSGAMLIMSISVVWLNALTGTGQTKINLLTEMIAVTLYMGYTWYIIKIKHLPLAYAWSNEWIYWTSTFTIAFIFMNRSKWKKIA